MKEIFKDIPGYKDIYKVSNLGNVKSVDRLVNAKGNVKRLQKGRLLKPQLTYVGYYRVELSKKGTRKKHSIHRLVALAFIPNPDNKPTVNHIDKCRINNRVDNLEWATSKEQIEHSYNEITANQKRGEEHPCNKLTEQQVLEIGEALSKGVKAKGLAKQYNVCAVSISDIKNRCTWKHLVLPKPFSSALSDATKENIKKDLIAGISQRKLAKKYNTTKWQIQKLCS